MARNKGREIELTAYDDLFQTDESREEAKLSKIREIPISEIDEFPDHPFRVLMDEDMEQLVESIRRSGVMTPATVRFKEDGRYECCGQAFLSLLASSHTNIFLPQTKMNIKNLQSPKRRKNMFGLATLWALEQQDTVFVSRQKHSQSLVNFV